MDLCCVLETMWFEDTESSSNGESNGATVAEESDSSEDEVDRYNTFYTVVLISL